MKTPDEILDILDVLPDAVGKLDIDIYQGKTDVQLKAEYEEKRKEYITDKIINGDCKRDKAEALWDDRYPNGYSDWITNYRTLNGYGEQSVIDKVNDIIKTVNQIINYLKK